MDEDTDKAAEARASNPNAAGPQGLAGDMGVSSERTGPGGPGDTAAEGIEGTGTVGTATERTEGTMDTERQHTDLPAEGPEMDEGQNEAQEDWREDKPEAGHDQVDRTVGENNTAEVPSHPSDPKDNPGHSHG